MADVPRVNQRILDGGLGIPANTPELLHVGVGVSSGGIRNKARLRSNVTETVAAMHAGPLVTKAAHHLQRAGQLWTVRTATSNNGTIGAVTKNPAGTSTGTMTATLSNYPLHAAIAGGAPLAVTTGWMTLPIPGKVTFVLGGTAVATTFTLLGKDLEGNLLPPENIAIALGGGTFVSVNEYTSIVSLTSNIDPVATTNVSMVSTTPVDAYEMVIEIMTTGNVAAQTMQFRYSMDKERTWSQTLTVPAGGIIDLQTYAPGSNNPYLGFKLTFVDGAGPVYFLKGDKFTFETQAPTWSLNDLLTALDAVANDPDMRALYSGFHIVGAADGSVFSAVESQLASYADLLYQYRFCYIEAVRQGVTAEATWAANVVTTFNSVVGVRTGVVAMDGDIDDPATRTFPRRNLGSVYMARLMICPISELPSHVKCGTIYGDKFNIEGMQKLYQGDSSNTVLTQANIAAFRTYTTRLGFYITRGIMKTQQTSDYRDVTNRRVMDVAATVGYDAVLDFLQAELLANPSTGQLDQTEADKIRTTVLSALSVALLGGTRRHVSALDVVVSTANNYLRDRTINDTIRIVPRGAVDFINQEYSYAPQI